VLPTVLDFLRSLADAPDVRPVLRALKSDHWIVNTQKKKNILLNEYRCCTTYEERKNNLITFPQATIFLLVILLVLFQQSYLSKKTSKPTRPDLWRDGLNITVYNNKM
jgi:hypothetical protein